MLWWGRAVGGVSPFSLYYYRYKEYIGGLGKEFVTTTQPGNLFLFRFVFVSCVRAGEAKLCGRVRGECLSTLGVSILTFPAAPAVVVPFAFLSLCARVLRKKLRSYCYAHGLFDLFLFLMVRSWVF
jgi:hypothetical protein